MNKIASIQPFLQYIQNSHQFIHRMQSLIIVSLQLLLFSFLISSTDASQTDEQGYIFCDSTGADYTNGSIYEKNVNITLTSLTANASTNSFFITTIGQDLNTVYGLVQCRSDVSKEDCQICVDTAAKQITQFCPNKKEAMIGYNYCSIRYSNWSFFSIAGDSQLFTLYNTGNVTDPDVFNIQMANLLRNLSSTAASSASKFALGRIGYTDLNDIYGMVECTRDLTENICSSCLQAIISYIPQCCNQKQGARIFSMSCNLRFELYTFFLTSSPPIVQPLSPPPPPPLFDPNSIPVAMTKTNGSGRKKTMVVVPVISGAGVAFLVILTICCCFFWIKAKKKSAADVLEDCGKNMETSLIGLDALKAATGNFSDEYKLGQGGFGPVYKGKMVDGKEIAMKRLSRNSGQGLEELKTEVMLVAKLLHRNLVRLLGFCLEEEEKLLVYEYLPNGSLDKFLFDQSKRFNLDRKRRYNIIVGIARGLLYLHEDSQLRIVHRDLKASNVLLDENMNPKISDFGLAKLFGESQTQGNTNRISGTYGYMAPEYAKNSYFSTKSDVYGFGVLVLEIVTGRKNTSRNYINLQSQAWLHWTKGTAPELLDPMLNDQWPRLEVLKCIHIGLLCVQEAAADRPTMSDINTMLSTSYSISVPTPSRPAYFASGENLTRDSCSSQSGDLMPDAIQQFVNDYNQ